MLLLQLCNKNIPVVHLVLRLLNTELQKENTELKQRLNEYSERYGETSSKLGETLSRCHKLRDISSAYLVMLL